MAEKLNLMDLSGEEAIRLLKLMDTRDDKLVAMRDEIDRLTHLENIPKKPGKRARTQSEDVLFVEVGRAYYGRREVFGVLAEKAAREGDETFFTQAAKYLAQIKRKESNSEPFTRHVMWALVFVYNALVARQPMPAKSEVVGLVRKQLKARGVEPMQAGDDGWKNVWRASQFLQELPQTRPGSVPFAKD